MIGQIGSASSVYACQLAAPTISKLLFHVLFLKITYTQRAHFIVGGGGIASSLLIGCSLPPPSPSLLGDPRTAHNGAVAGANRSRYDLILGLMIFCSLPTVATFLRNIMKAVFSMHDLGV